MNLKDGTPPLIPPQGGNGGCNPQGGNGGCNPQGRKYRSEKEFNEGLYKFVVNRKGKK